MRTDTIASLGNFAKTASIPPLMAGDRLSRTEYERRYEAMPQLKKAELIEGVVYLGAKVPIWHGSAHATLMGLIGLYSAWTSGVMPCDNSTIRLDNENVPQPDILLRIEEEFGGQSRVGADRLIEGAPELVAEISATTANYDLHDKLRAYQRNGAREYLVWRVWDAELDWFVLRDSKFERMAADSVGRFKSAVFPGLWIDSESLMKNNLPAALTHLQEGLNSPEHAAFLAQLQTARGQAR